MRIAREPFSPLVDRFMIRWIFLLAVATLSLEASAQSWRLLHPVLAHTVIVNPQNPRTLWIGNWANQTWRSYDGGSTWDLVEIGSTDVTNFISSMAYSSLDTNVILASGIFFDGIRRTTDGGSTWTRVYNTGSGVKAWFISEAIIEDHSRPGVFFAARGSTSFTDVWESPDNGVTWDSVGKVPTTITQRLCTITQRPDSANIFFIGAKKGIILRSDDRCRTWRTVPVQDGAMIVRGDAEIPKIVFSQRDPRIGYAVVAITDPDSISNNGGVLRTTDGGATWDRMAFPDTSLWALDVRTHSSGEDELFVGGFRTNNRPTTIKGDSLVFTSTNGGSTWTRYENIPWGQNELQDTIRNAWVIRWEPKLRRVYMAAETGLFILDEPTSVANTDLPASAGLRVVATSDAITVTDLEDHNEPLTWSIYTMAGTQVGGGAVRDPQATVIPTDGLGQGAYLLLWSTPRRIRTATVMIQR